MGTYLVKSRSNPANGGARQPDERNWQFFQGKLPESPVPHNEWADEWVYSHNVFQALFKEECGPTKDSYTFVGDLQDFGLAGVKEREALIDRVCRHAEGNRHRERSRPQTDFFSGDTATQRESALRQYVNSHILHMSTERFMETTEGSQLREHLENGEDKRRRLSTAMEKREKRIQDEWAE